MEILAQQGPPPGYKTTHFPDRQWNLFLPSVIHDALATEERVRKEEERRAYREARQALENESREDDDLVKADDEVAEPDDPFPGHPSLQIFDPEVITCAMKRLAKEDKERAARQMPTVEEAGNWHGRRRLLEMTIPVMSERLRALGSTMPNFQATIDLLIGELALAMAGPAEAFRVSPIALYGTPGIGKTRFAREVAAILQVGFEAIALGATGGGFEIAGVSAGFGNSRPGRITRVLAQGEMALPVVLLDEIDKMTGDDRFPVLPTLLELLEPDSARTFRDEGLEIRFDASRILFLATANEAERIPAPLQSRLRMVEVSAPTPEQRRQIVERLASEFQGIGIGFPVPVLDRLATAELDLRALQRVIRETAGRTLAAGRQAVAETDLVMPAQATRKEMGFL
jgi:ATP-dependent Lon protease